MHEKPIGHCAGLSALALCLCLVAPVPIARAQEVARPQKHKSPAAAWALSFVYAGAGHVYNGEWGRAAAFAVPASIGWGLYWNSWEDCHVNHTNCATRNVSVVMIMSSWIVAQIDAPLRARAINRKRGVSLEFGPAPNQLGVSLARISF